MHSKLISGPLKKSILLFALPIFISNIFQQLYNTVDTMIVGHFLGVQALAAVGSTASLFDLIVGFAMGISVGLGIVVARYFGATKETMVKKSVAWSILIGLGFSLMVMAIGILGLRPLLHLVQTPPEVIDQAQAYIQPIVLCVGVTFFYNLGAGILRSIGDSMAALVILILAALTNVVLDIVFITQFGLGVFGASLATVVSQGISAILCFAYIFYKVKLLIPHAKHFAWDGKLVANLVGQGLAMAMMNSIVSMGSVILQAAVNQFGVMIMAAQIGARRIQSFLVMPFSSLASASVTFCSQNLGAKQFDRIKQGVRFLMWTTFFWSLVCIAIAQLGAPVLIGLLTGSKDANVLSYGSSYLKISTAFYPALGLLLILRNSLQGLGQTSMPILSSVIELSGKVAFVFWVIPIVGYWGILYCEPLIWLVMAMQLGWGYWRAMKRPLA